MDELNLVLEVGSEAIDELSSTEKSAILSKYSNGQEALAGLKVFGILMKKFKPTYRIGRMYEELSAKYERYRDLYNLYATSVNAGKVAKDPDDITEYDIDRWKWPSQTR